MAKNNNKKPAPNNDAEFKNEMEITDKKAAPSMKKETEKEDVIEFETLPTDDATVGQSKPSGGTPVNKGPKPNGSSKPRKDRDKVPAKATGSSGHYIVPNTPAINTSYKPSDKPVYALAGRLQPSDQFLATEMLNQTLANSNVGIKLNRQGAIDWSKGNSLGNIKQMVNVPQVAIQNPDSETFVDPVQLAADVMNNMFDQSSNKVPGNYGSSNLKLAKLSSSLLNSDVTMPVVEQARLEGVFVNLFHRNMHTAKSYLFLPARLKSEKGNVEEQTGLEKITVVLPDNKTTLQYSNTTIPTAKVDVSKYGEKIIEAYGDTGQRKVIDLSLEKGNVADIVNYNVEADTSLTGDELNTLSDIATIGARVREYINSKPAMDKTDALRRFQSNQWIAAVMNGMPKLKTLMLCQAYAIFRAFQYNVALSTKVAFSPFVWSNGKTSTAVFTVFMEQVLNGVRAFPKECPIDTRVFRKFKDYLEPFMHKQKDFLDYDNVMEIPVLFFSTYEGQEAVGGIAKETYTNMWTKIKSHISQYPLIVPHGDWISWYYETLLAPNFTNLPSSPDLRKVVAKLDPTLTDKWESLHNPAHSYSVMMTGWMNNVKWMNQRLIDHSSFAEYSTTPFWQVMCEMTKGFSGLHNFGPMPEDLWSEMEDDRNWRQKEIIPEFNRDKVIQSNHRIFCERVGGSWKPYTHIYAYMAKRLTTRNLDASTTLGKEEPILSMAERVWAPDTYFEVPKDVDEVLRLLPVPIIPTNQETFNNAPEGTRSYDKVDKQVDAAWVYKNYVMFNDNWKYLPYNKDGNNTIYNCFTNDPRDGAIDGTAGIYNIQYFTAMLYAGYKYAPTQNVSAYTGLTTFLDWNSVAGKGYYCRTISITDSASSGLSQVGFKRAGMPYHESIANNAGAVGTLKEYFYDCYSRYTGRPSIYFCDANDNHNGYLFMKDLVKYCMHKHDIPVQKYMHDRYSKATQVFREMSRR
jgi:hypothetical protein